MFFAFKRFLPILAVPLVSGGLALATPVQAEDGLSLSARMDQVENQIESAFSRLQVAQNYNYGRPRANVGMGGDDDSYDSPAPYGRGNTYNGGGYNNGAAAENPAGLEVRMSHIEEQIRQINGQVEQLQFAEHKLEDQLKKFQQDVDFRFQDTSVHASAKPQKRTDVQDGEAGMQSPPAAVAEISPPAGALRGGRRGDAFDPSLDPAAPGAPHPLGSIASGMTNLPPPESAKQPAHAAGGEVAELDADPNAPLDLSSGRRVQPSASTPANVPPGFGTQSAPRQIPLTGTQSSPAAGASPAPTQLATVPPVVSPRDEFDSALASYKQKEYETAEKGFSTFLQKNPKNRMAPDAIYYLGETYFKRNRPREAAEQYLKISTDYASSTHAPEAMLNLGRSLKALDAKEQACASFSQVTQKYPNAQAWVKNTAELEARNLHC
jgi:tol-pal system protein YbgF